MRKFSLLFLLFFLISCRTVYIRPSLPDYDGGRVDFSQYNAGSLNDLKRIIVLQDEIIKGWEKFYASLQKSNTKH